MNRETTQKLIRVGIALIYLIVTATASLMLFSHVRSLVSASALLPTFTVVESQDSPNVSYQEGQPLPTWTGTERVTVLLLGIDEREQEEGPFRTDTIILVTLDPVTLQAGVLSIPRDLWVHIPGYTENRINTAHFLGDAYNHPGGGPALTIETLRYNLGVEIDYFVRVNFDGFIRLVDEIGGIDIYVEERIDDPQYPTADYGVERLIIEEGLHHFNGDLALKYARTRYSASGDFGRARRQQQVILAILDKVTRTGSLPRLAARAPAIYSAVADSVTIDAQLQLDEIIALAVLATQVDRDEIRFGVIDESCTLFRVTPEGYQILLPLRNEIREVRDYVFGVTQAINGPLEEDDTTIAVLNGAGIAGLAGQAGAYLESYGLNVEEYANADRADYVNSLIILNRNRPATALRLVNLLGLPQSAVVNGDNPAAPYDITIILGADYPGPPPAFDD